MLSSSCAAGGGGEKPQSLYHWKEAAPACFRPWQASKLRGKFLQLPLPEARTLLSTSMRCRWTGHGGQLSASASLAPSGKPGCFQRMQMWQLCTHLCAMASLC